MNISKSVWIATVAVLTMVAPALARGHHHRHHYPYHRYHAHFAAPSAGTDPLTAFFNGLGSDSQVAYLDTSHKASVVYRSRYFRPVRTSVAIVSRFPVMARRSIGNVSDMIASQASARLGRQWVATALQIAKIESGGRCNAHNPSGASGVFQVMHPEQFGVSRSAAHTCAGGIQAGISHMQRCIQHGARTASQMLACHNSGNPFASVRHLERAYQIALR